LDTSMIDIENVPYFEQIYRQWRENPESVPADWRKYFASLDNGRPAAAGATAGDTAATGDAAATATDTAQTVTESGALAGAQENRQSRVDRLIWAYRDVGYVYAKTNPLEGYLTPALRYLHKSIEGIHESLSLGEFGLTEKDLSREFSAGPYLHPSRAPLGTILSALKETYCSYLGAEIMHIQNRPMRRWLIGKVESGDNQPSWSAAQQQLILQDLIKAEEFERFLQRTYIGQKRFSLEGGEVLIPALHHLVDTAAHSGIQEIVLGMAHRGRLNVLTNIMDKSPAEIFAAFEGQHHPHTYGGSGDMKYHLGYSLDHQNEDGSTIHISLVANPSHLESVGPVVEGKARGVQRRRGDVNKKKVLPVLIHGDAALTGQGVVSETFNLSRLRGYRTGGTIHVVINNQIGFTTASADARSSFFPTDVAKSISIPIFHVNGDRVEHVIRAVDLALRFRQKFGYDVVVDIVCYRRYGHNEADEPSFTHPLMYRIIEKHPSPAVIYGRHLEERGISHEAEQQSFRKAYEDVLKADLEKARNGGIEYRQDAYGEGDWKDFRPGYSHDIIPTGVDRKTLSWIAEKLTALPEDMEIHSKLERILQNRRQMLASGQGIDWGTAESLAFGSLLLEATHVRLSGEDCARGTFSHRHAVWWDIGSSTPRYHIPLNHLSPDQAEFSVYDSPLSEFSVLGFEYGYSLAQPKSLVLWEAQFGDFANGAQVIIDQFIAAGEAKWTRASGLVMLLPHGYEGQGPEHSSAHLERYLQLCAADNLQVCNPTTPAQYFHLLRRQVRRPFRKPLIIMTPKSLLRHRMAVSEIKELTDGSFLEVLEDAVDGTKDQKGSSKPARSLLLCSGKVYYDLAKRRESSGRHDTAILRLEQLYPFPEERLARILSRYQNAERFIWVQEESRNRGAWSFVREKLSPMIQGKLEYVGRPESASPATGYFAQHTAELKEMLSLAFPEAAAAEQPSMAAQRAARSKE
jgi:2-oxoglutarate dehydrogenase E1 component